MQKGELRLRVQDEEVRFSVFRAIRHPTESESCYRIKNIESIVSNHEDTNDLLEISLLQVDPLELDDEAKAYVQWMNSFEENHLSRRHHSLNINSYPSICGMLIWGTLLRYQSSSQHH